MSPNTAKITHSPNSLIGDSMLKGYSHLIEVLITFHFLMMERGVSGVMLEEPQRVLDFLLNAKRKPSVVFDEPARRLKMHLFSPAPIKLSE